MGTARRRRDRFLAQRLEGLLDEPRPGRPRTVTGDQVEAVITRTSETTPRGATHWSTRSPAAELGLSQSAVSRIWGAFGLQVRDVPDDPLDSIYLARGLQPLTPPIHRSTILSIVLR